jgi:hypothetical protein
VHKRPIDSFRSHGSSPPVPSRLAQPHVRWREVGGKSRPSPAQSPTPIPCRVVAFWSLIQTCCLAAYLNRPHERTERGQGFVHNRGARHHESADNDQGGVSEANDSCWQQNPAEVQQNSSKWGQRIGWTVSKSTRVRWGPEFVHPTRTLRSPSTSSRLRACWTKPGAGWVDSHPGHVDPPSVQLEEAQHGQAPQPDGLDREEVAGDDPGGLLSEERPPRRGRPSRSWIYPMTSERCADRGCRDSHAQPLEFTLHALVTRARNLASQADDQLLYVGVQLRPARGTMRISPGTCDQPPMPAQQRLRPNEEARPARPWQDAADRGEQGSVGGLQLGTWGLAAETTSWWRRTRSSRSLAASPRASSTSSWIDRHSVR